MVIHQLHGCDSVYVESVPVREVFKGKTVWDGAVEVFSLRNHATSPRCYAWSYKTEADGERMVAVLEKPPVVSPELAVRAAIASQYKKDSAKYKV
jgi:hypothetical protein